MKNIIKILIILFCLITILVLYINRYLGQFTPWIKNLEQFKSVNGYYPDKYSDELKNPKIIHSYYYKTENDKKDFKIYFETERYTPYQYCSNKNSQNCKDHRAWKHLWGNWFIFNIFEE